MAAIDIPLTWFKENVQQDNEDREKACSQMKALIEFQSVRLSTETFTAFLTKTMKRVFALLGAQTMADQLAGVLAVDALVRAKTSNDEMKVVQLSNHLWLVFVKVTNGTVLKLAAATLGRLATSLGNLNLSVIDYQLRMALEWLEKGDSVHLLSAVLILKNIAENSPTMFFPKVGKFIQLIDVALQDNREDVRDTAAQALGTCLMMVEERAMIEDRVAEARGHWLNQVLSIAINGLQRTAHASIHGALLVIEEILKHTGNFLEKIEQYSFICGQVLRLKDNRSRLIRRSVSKLLPPLASFKPDVFIRDHLRVALRHVLRAVTQGGERSTAFIALGRLAVAVEDALSTSEMNKIFALVADSLTPRARKPFCPGAFNCVALFAQALGPTLLRHINMITILDKMFSSGLHSTLIEALRAIVQHIPQLYPLIEQKLINEIGLVLGGAPYKQPQALLGLTKMKKAHRASFDDMVAESETCVANAAKIREFQRSRLAYTEATEGDGLAKLKLALQTLATFNLDGILLLPFVRDYVLPYLHSQTVALRMHAAHAVSQLLLRPADPVPGRSTAAVLVSETLQELLAIGISDPAVEIRRAIIGSLAPAYDVYVSQDNLLRFIFIALNDEDYVVKMKTMAVIRRVVHTNPAFVLPALRKVVKQHLTELKYGSTLIDQHNSLLLLSQLISSSPTIVKPHVRDILQALMPKLKSSDSQVSASALTTLSQLTTVDQEIVALHVHQLLPLIVQQLQDQTSLDKMQVALGALGNVIQCTSIPIAADPSFPQLSRTILKLVQLGGTLPWELQVETQRLFGLIGAVDPFTFEEARSRDISTVALAKKSSKPLMPGAATNGAAVAGAGVPVVTDPAQGIGTARVDTQAKQPDAGTTAMRAGSPRKPHHGAAKRVATDETGADADFKDPYVPTIQDFDFAEYHAIRTLVDILRNTEPQVQVHHRAAIHALIFIFRSHHQKCVRFLPEVVAALLFVLDRCQLGLRSFILSQFLILIRITLHDFRPHVAALIQRCVKSEFFTSCLKVVLKVLIVIATTMRDEFKTFLPLVMPKILSELQLGPQLVIPTQPADLRSQSPQKPSKGQPASKSASKFKTDAPSRTLLIIASLAKFGSTLEEYIHLLIPLLVSLCQLQAQAAKDEVHLAQLSNIMGLDAGSIPGLLDAATAESSSGGTKATAAEKSQRKARQQLHIRVAAVRTLGLLARHLDVSEYASQIIHPLTRILKQQSIDLELACGAMATLDILIRQLGPDSPWYSMLRRAFSQQQGGSGLPRQVRRQFDALTTYMDGPHKHAGTLYRTGPAFGNVGMIGGAVGGGETGIGGHVIGGGRTVPGAFPLNNSVGLGTSPLASLRDGMSLERDMHFDNGSPRGSHRMDFDVGAVGARNGDRGTAGDGGGGNNIGIVDDPVINLGGNIKKMVLDQANLQHAWDVQHRSTPDDWVDWIRRFSIELLRESPSGALRACFNLAQVYFPMAQSLFNCAFLVAWVELRPELQDSLVSALETSFRSPHVSQEICQTLLTLAEEMERNDNALPIDIRVLGDLATRNHVYAKALRYTELQYEEYLASSHIEQNKQAIGSCIEALISVNNELNYPDAAVGILTYSQQNNHVEDLQESWYEKLGRWQEALHSYDKRIAAVSVNLRPQDGTHGLAGQSAFHSFDQPPSEIPADMLELSIGKMRCLDALGDWPELINMAHSTWPYLQHDQSQQIRWELAPHIAKACWYTQDWDGMHEYTSHSNPDTVVGSLLRAVVAVHNNSFSEASSLIDITREKIAPLLTPLVKEGYGRAYKHIVQLQQLAELEEIVSYKRMLLACKRTPKEDQRRIDAEKFRLRLQKAWPTRISSAQSNVDVWQSILAIRSLVTPHTVDTLTWLKFVAICRDNGCPILSFKTLFSLGIPPKFARLLSSHTKNGIEKHTRTQDSPFSGTDSFRGISDAEYDAITGVKVVIDAGHDRHVKFALYKQLRATGRRLLAVQGLEELVDECDTKGWAQSDIPLMVRVHLRLGLWNRELSEQYTTYSDEQEPATPSEMNGPQILKKQEDDDAKMRYVAESLRNFEKCTKLDPNYYKGWHHWAMINFEMVEDMKASFAKLQEKTESPSYERKYSQTDFKNHIRKAANGFFKSIVLGRARSKSNVLQDILRLLTLWFTDGGGDDMFRTFSKGFDDVPIGLWLEVVPQLIARIHTQTPQVNVLLTKLLTRIGKTHPQALIYALSVPSASHIETRRTAALAVLNQLRQGCGKLVDQAQVVSSELIRVAILWHEEWHGGLEDASRLYFGEHDVDGLFDVLYPLHEKIAKKTNLSMREKSFLDAFGVDLAEAKRWLDLFKRDRVKSDVKQAWDIYYSVFTRINSQLPGLTHLELPFVSPPLQEARNLDLAVPGSYRAGQPVVRIARFVSSIRVLSSKQRPRRITIVGSDGINYRFLLKGHEDLRQDERVMQLLGLVNTLLSNNAKTARSGLHIEQYDVIPLSHNCGIVQWLPRTDTLHELIRSYRTRRNILLNLEHRHILRMAPDYDLLPLLGRLEVFEHVLTHSTGKDLCKLLWLKSKNSEIWLRRRTKYTRSLAVMNIVGYILGLGDRHPSNLMLHRDTGQLIHVDFGDCFEVAQTRDKFPEKIPFRLTRMMVNAMELSGVEGSYRKTSELVLADLRRHRDSVLAMLEAFIHDPLINWRLNSDNDPDDDQGSVSSSAANSPSAARSREHAQAPTGARRRSPKAPPSTDASHAPDSNDPQAAASRPAPATKNPPASSTVREAHDAAETPACDVDDTPNGAQISPAQALSSAVEDPQASADAAAREDRILEEDEEDPNLYDDNDDDDDDDDDDGRRLHTPPSRQKDPFAASTSLKPSRSLSISCPTTPNQANRKGITDDGEAPEGHSVESEDDGARVGTAIEKKKKVVEKPFSVAQEEQRKQRAEEIASSGVATSVMATSFMQMLSMQTGKPANDDGPERAVSSSLMTVVRISPASSHARGVVIFRAITVCAATLCRALRLFSCARVGLESPLLHLLTVYRQDRTVLPAVTQHWPALPSAPVVPNFPLKLLRPRPSRYVLVFDATRGRCERRITISRVCMCLSTPQAIRRVRVKLTGRDFKLKPRATSAASEKRGSEGEPLDVAEQVDRLINEATSHKNLCQCYSGWCPFW